MVETHWEDLRDRELRYQGHRWSLTGDVALRETGDLLAVEARQADGTRHEDATLYFAIRDPPASLNPGNLGDHFDELEYDGAGQTLVVSTAGRTYRYRLTNVEYD